MTKPRKGRVEIDGVAPQSVFRVGCAGWTIPRECSASFSSEGSHLERYSRIFNCCEINSSFYRPHRKETWRRWAASVPEDFRFSVKAPRAITHESALRISQEILSTFLEQIKCLNGKLGPILFQLPPSLEFEQGYVRSFLRLLRGNFIGDVVCEPRHSSWFQEEADILLKDFRIARVAADPACVVAGSQPGGFPAFAYFRLHGSPRRYYSGYSNDFLNSLAVRMRDVGKGSQAWCIFDNTAAGMAAQNALELTSRLEKDRNE
ncbi:MAG TPA: DUF72 domain-containing protein [Candidatus Sulfotelmatobacter sp.]